MNWIQEYFKIKTHMSVIDIGLNVFIITIFGIILILINKTNEKPRKN